MTNQQQTTISPELRDFLQSWLDWVEAGAPDIEPYWRQFGLCSNAYVYCKQVNTLVDIEHFEEALYDLLREDFGEIGGWAYPFGYNNYHYGVENASQHLDSNRIAWVKEKLR